MFESSHSVSMSDWCTINVLSSLFTSVSQVSQSTLSVSVSFSVCVSLPLKRHMDLSLPGDVIRYKMALEEGGQKGTEQW